MSASEIQELKSALKEDKRKEKFAPEKWYIFLGKFMQCNLREDQDRNGLRK